MSENTNNQAMQTAPVPTMNFSSAVEPAPQETTAPQVATVSPGAEKAVQVAAAAVAELDTSMLSEDEMKKIDAFIEQIDLGNSDHVLLYGSDAQKKIAEFSDNALNSVRTSDSGEVGDMLVKLVNEIQGFNSATEKPKGIAGLFWNAKKAVSDMQTEFSTIETNVDTIADSLEAHQIQLLKDISLFNRLYDMNMQYFKELTMYIVAGEKKLAQVRNTTLVELLDKAQKSGDAMDAQRANDVKAQCDQFEKKLHDLKLTRQVALQMAPQIRLLQNNNGLLVERIQSTLSNTLPLWKSQMVIALGMHRSKEALRAQTAVTNMTNELLTKNAEALRVGTVETAREAERGIIDINTLVQTNQSLINSINEVMQIQKEGRQNRLAAEQQMATMEKELKTKLLTL